MRSRRAPFSSQTANVTPSPGEYTDEFNAWPEAEQTAAQETIAALQNDLEQIVREHSVAIGVIATPALAAQAPATPAAPALPPAPQWLTVAHHRSSPRGRNLPRHRAVPRGAPPGPAAGLTAPLTPVGEGTYDDDDLSRIMQRLADGDAAGVAAFGVDLGAGLVGDAEPALALVLADLEAGGGGKGERRAEGDAQAAERGGLAVEAVLDQRVRHHRLDAEAVQDGPAEAEGARRPAPQVDGVVVARHGGVAVRHDGGCLDQLIGDYDALSALDHGARWFVDRFALGDLDPAVRVVGEDG